MGQFDWTQVSDDPNNSEAKAQVRRLLPVLRQVQTHTDLTGFAQECVQGKRVLDVGVVSHSAHYFEDAGWRHGKIVASASYCVGLDILEPLVQQLNQQGYNVRCMDATSEEDVGERFDVVFIGDVIEHVENPTNLLRFAKRHLLPNGRILVATPNPFSRKFFRRFFKQGVVVVNLDHLAWFTPTMALELARRTGLDFYAYHLVKPMSGLKLALHQLAWKWNPPDYSFHDYLFEFRLPSEA